MEFEIAEMTPAQRYKVLISLVVPRPIALVSSLSEGGVVNAAPFSFFNLLGEDPPICIFAVDRRLNGEPKDTERNILANREYVINLVDEDIAERMHGCAVDAPAEMSEIDLVGFNLAPSRAVRPPRIADSPVSIECRLHTELDFKTRRLIIGELQWLHVRDGIIDPLNLRRIEGAYRPIGRLYANRYCLTRDEFALDNSAYAEAAQAFAAKTLAADQR